MVKTVTNMKLEETLRLYILQPVLEKLDDNQPLHYLSEMRQVSIIFMNMVLVESPDVSSLLQQMFSIVHTESKAMNGFRAIDLQEQVKLVQGSIYPIVIITLAQHYDPDNGSYNYFNFSKAEEEHIMKIFPMLRVLQKHFDHVGQIVKIFNFDQVEFVIFSAILLLSSENYTNGLTRFGILLLRLGELSVINQQHNQAITVLLSKHAYLNIPQLYKEMILKH